MKFTYNIRYYQQRTSSVDSNLFKVRFFVRPNVLVVVPAVLQRSGLLI
jgi:hypothetical protein